MLWLVIAFTYFAFVVTTFVLYESDTVPWWARVILSLLWPFTYIATFIAIIVILIHINETDRGYRD